MGSCGSNHPFLSDPVKAEIRRGKGSSPWPGGRDRDCDRKNNKSESAEKKRYIKLRRTLEKSQILAAGKTTSRSWTTDDSSWEGVIREGARETG